MELTWRGMVRFLWRCLHFRLYLYNVFMSFKAIFLMWIVVVMIISMKVLCNLLFYYPDLGVLMVLCICNDHSRVTCGLHVYLWWIVLWNEALHMWTLFEYFILCMLGFFYSNDEYDLVSYDIMWVYGLNFLNVLHVSCSWLKEYIWWVVS